MRQPTVNFDFNSGVDPEQLSKDMAEVMFENGGLGLAAPQVGLNYRMFLMGDPESAVACFNPRIIEVSQETTYDVEGCLSFPGLYVAVERAKSIFTKFKFFDGEEQGASFTDISARIFQHESEHMDGDIFIDNVSSFRLKSAMKKRKQFLKKMDRR